MSGEHSVAQAKASVMIYNNELKKWEHAGGSQGISRVHVYFNPSGESYRIVGRKVNDNEVVINCLIVKNLKYNKATATFHQWRDQRQVYGLNFATPDDAICFSEAVLGAIEYLSNPAPEPSPQYNTNDSHAGVPYQKSQEDSYQQQQSVSLVQQITPVIKSQQSAPEPPPAPPVPAIVSSVPPSVPAPPPPKSSVPNVQAPPVAPPTVGGAPPPPPPPPPPAFSGPPAPPPPPLPGGGNATGINTSATGGNNAFADALAGVQLKKRVEASIEERRPTLSNANPMDDMMSALNRKLLARKQKADGDDDITDGSNPSAPVKAPIPITINKSVPVSNNKTVVAPKQTKLPIQTKDPTPVASSVGSVSSLSSDEFKLLKEELLSSIREEINAAKNEIIEAIREELSRLN